MRKLINFILPLMCLSLLAGCGENKKTYTVIWKNYDGSILEVDNNATEGSKPEYNKQTPTKEGNEFCNYSFIGWDKELEEVHSDQTYIAKFNADIKPTVTSFDVTLKRDLEFKFVSISSIEGQNLKINWGDGTTGNSETSHTYQSAGNYTIMVSNLGLVNCEANNTITAISFGTTVTEIDKSAFFDCSKITSVSFTDTITSIGNGAFYRCESLETLELPNNVKSIGGSAFYGCKLIEKLYIPASTELIGTDAFKHCSSLEEIKVDPMNQYYDSRNDCNCLINKTKKCLLLGCKNSFIPNGVEILSCNCFAECSYLESIEIPSSVTKIEDKAFYRCTRLKSIVIPESVSYIGYSVFLECAKLESVSILSNQIKTINHECFYRCFKLKEINIPSSVTKIGPVAFCECTSLESIFVPKSVTTMNEDVFFGCASLTIYCEAEEQPAGWSDSWNSSNRLVLWGQHSK
mgnify:CR=1 FL=1